MTVTPCDTPEALSTALTGAGSKLVVVDFHATWCGPCKRIAPFLAKLSETLTDVVFLKKVDVDENSDASEKYGIEAMPTFKFIKNGEVVETVTGADESSIEATARQFK
ncbi:unnamed protein product [Ectocarpus sp. 12 AP-2014]